MVSIRLAKNLSVPSEKLLSYHIGISGMTGSGKSRNVSARLLRQCLEKRPEGPEGTRYAFIVIDTNSEYFTFQDAYPKQVIVFSPDVTKGVPLRISSKNVTVDDISVFLREITRREVSKSDTAAIFLAIDELRAKGDYTLEQVYMKLYEIEAYSILPAFEKMIKTGIFGPEETPLSLLVRPGEASIIDIGGYSTEVQAITFAHLARRLFEARTNKQVPCLILFLEEASVFGPEGKLSPASEILKSIATQGRGYDFILVSIFQRSSLTDITLRSQCHNWIIGKTGNPLDRQAVMKAAEKIETEHDNVIKNLAVGREFLVTGLMVDEPKLVTIPDQKLLARKGGRITQKTIKESFKREDLAKYIESIRQTETNERQRLEETTAHLRAEREAKIKRPSIPREAQHEIERLKKNLESAQKRYEEAISRADDRIKEKYAAKMKELEETVEQLTKQLTLKGAATETVWDHPLVQKWMREKLTAQQFSLVEFLEKAGASGPEKIAAFLGCKPQTIPGYISKINGEMPNLVGYDSRGGTYQSRLQEIFPVTEAAKAESEKLKQLTSDLQYLRDRVDELTLEKTELLTKLGHLQKESAVDPQRLSALTVERDRYVKLYHEYEDERQKLNDQLKELKERLVKFSTLESAIKDVVGTVSSAQPDTSFVDRLKKEVLAEVRNAMDDLPRAKGTLKVEDKITSIEVHDKDETITADRTSLRGRIALLIAKYGFMSERHSLSQFVQELSNHTWIHDKSEVEKELIWLCDAGIMQRKISTGKMWWYTLFPGTEERIQIVHE